jgi:hypothetical protein
MKIIVVITPGRLHTERGSWLAQEIIARVVNEIRELAIPLDFPA